MGRFNVESKEAGDEMAPSALSALLVLALGGSLVSGETPALSRADLARLAKEQALRFKTHARELPPHGTSWFEAVEGSSQILVTAPHATAQTREGRLKGSDLGTGALAVVLHRLAGAPALYTTWASPSDPNYYDDNAFKDELASLAKTWKPKLVLDLHASREDRPYDLDLGTLQGASVQGQAVALEILRRRLAEAGVRDLSENAFSGERQATVVRFLHRLGVPCIQLEINARWLRPEHGPEEMQRFIQLANALAAFIRDMDKT